MANLGGSGEVANGEAGGGGGRRGDGNRQPRGRGGAHGGMWGNFNCRGGVDGVISEKDYNKIDDISGPSCSITHRDENEVVPEEPYACI